MQDGDWIEPDVPNRKLNLLVSEEELAKRRAARMPPERKYESGFTALYLDNLPKPIKVVYFDFPHTGAPTPEPQMH